MVIVIGKNMIKINLFKLILFIIFFNSSFVYADVSKYLIIINDKPVEILLEKPQPSFLLTRLPGPKWPGPHENCMMCVANHLMGYHGITYEKLMFIGYEQWQTLHDNLHNDPSGSKAESFNYDAQIIGYGGGSNYSRGSILRRWR